MVFLNTLDKILRLLKSRNIEQQEFAKAIGVGKYAISEWKNGKTKSYLKHIDKIADFFNVSVDYLLGKTDDKLPSINLFEGVNMNTFNKQIYEQLTEEERKKVKEYILFLISQRTKDEEKDNEK